MPAFNAARYIDAAITSVLAQTVENLELIVVDDGSEDETAAVVARRAASIRASTCSGSRTPVQVRHEILRFRVARGRYFAFLDSDDEWAPTFLERQIAVLEARPDVDVLFGNAFYRGGARDGQPARPTMPDGRCWGLADLLADDSLHFIMAVFRREVIDAVHGFNPAFLTNEEYEMWLRAGLAGFTFARNAEPLGWYSCRPGSLSSSDTRMLEGALHVLAHTRPLLPEGSIERPILDRLAARYEAELATARVRDSLTAGDAVRGAHPSRGVAPTARRLDSETRGKASPGRHGAVSSPAGGAERRMSWRSTVRRAVDGFDAAVERTGRRRVLISVRTAMHAAVLDPIARALERDPRIDLRHIAERPDDEQPIAAGCGRSLRWTRAWHARADAGRSLRERGPLVSSDAVSGAAGASISFMAWPENTTSTAPATCRPDSTRSPRRLRQRRSDAALSRARHRPPGGGRPGRLSENRRARQRALRRRRGAQPPRPRDAPPDRHLRADVVAGVVPQPRGRGDRRQPRPPPAGT